jgi:hypothetical protein
MRRPAIVVVFLVGCGSGDETQPLPAGCKPDEQAIAEGGCVAAGLPRDLPCPPGEWLRETDGACIPAGVPPDGCAEGFVHDGDRGCDPIMPAEPCQFGSMAVPGETACHEVAPCGAAPWGDIPVEPDTEYVDLDYPGADSDGSAQKPWLTIQEAITAASPGAIVAIAAGSYVGDVEANGKAVRLWGRCPSLVAIVGTEFAVYLRLASHSEVHTLAIRGAGLGLLVDGGENVVADRLWVHDNPARGINVQGVLAPSSLAVTGSLIEGNGDIGVFAGAGAGLTIDATVIRDTQMQPSGFGGRAVSFASTISPDNRIVGSLLANSHEAAVVVAASTVTLDGTVVRDTQADGSGQAGMGVNVQPGPPSPERPGATILGSVVERSSQGGIVVTGGDLTMERSVVRDTSPSPALGYGRGLSFQDEFASLAQSAGTVRTSLFERNHQVGVLVGGSTADVESTAVRDTLSIEGVGYGIAVQRDPDTDVRSSSTVHASYVAGSTGPGIYVGASDATIDATHVQGGPPGEAPGVGIYVSASPDGLTPATASIRACLVEQTLQAGIAVTDADATVDACHVRDTLVFEGLYGDGLLATADRPATVTITATRVERSARAGIASFGAHVLLESTLFACQSFDLDAEPGLGTQAVFENLGNVACGCPAPADRCRAVSAELSAPAPLGPIQ